MTETAEKSLILNSDEITAKVNRIAWEIWERHFSSKQVYLVAVDFRGGFIASRLKSWLDKISDLETVILPVRTEKDSRGNTKAVMLEMDKHDLKGKYAIIVDDVLYSGKTMFCTLKTVMDLRPKVVQIAVLIDRGHRNIPVRPDYVGLELATTLKQHVQVEVADDHSRAEAFLL